MSDKPFTIHVDCYAGYRGEETPRTFSLGGHRIEVAEVIDQWLAPDHRYFKVRGNDANTYIIRHDPNADLWELTMFDKTSSNGNRQKVNHEDA